MKAEGKEKKQRQSQSCDACRVRKVKCEPMTPVSEGAATGTPKVEDAARDTGQEESGEGSQSKAPTSTGKAPCKQCFQLGVECLYVYRPRKRGPPNLYLRRLSEAQKSGQSFPAEADFEAAKASSRAVAERRKARGKGKDGHELEHVAEERKTGEDGESASWGVALDGSADGCTEMLGAPSSKSTDRTSRHSLSQTYDPRHLAVEDGHLMVESFVRTPLPNTSSRDQADHQRYSINNAATASATAPSAAEDAFTPSQFMNLDAELNFTTTPSNGKPSPAVAKYPPRHASRMDSFSISELGNMPSRHLANPHSGRSHPSRTDAYPTHHQYSSRTQQLPENTLNPILSPGDLERAGAYFTSPSESGSALGMGAGPSHCPLGASLPSMLPERLGSSPSRSISMDLSSFPNHHVDRDYLIRPSAAHSTTAVHNPSTGGTDIQVGLPMHTLTSKTLGEVGAPYFQNRGKDGNGHAGGSGRHGDSPPTILLGDAKKASFTEQGFGGPAILHQPSFRSINVNPLEAIIPRPLLQHIINLFFDYVYPLTPCLHKPTFIQDLARQREMEPNQGEWIALVLTTVMSTLVQVPRAFVPLTRREVKDLAHRCHIAGREWSLQGYKDFTVNAVIIRYFVYNYCRGEVATCHTSLCEAQALATVLRMHEEETYTYLNPIEREVRRRIFFLLFQADKSESVLAGRPIRLREEECYSLRLPEELDDDYITETRYLQQPEGMTSVITGFNASIRIHCLGGRAITKHKEDKRDPPTGVRLERRLEEVSMMLDEVTNIMKDCPPQLRLKEGLDSRVQSPAGGWDVEASAKLQAFFFDPQASREFARNAFMVQQGNCYVTKACVTFVLLQYQNDLLHLKAASSLNHGMRPSNGFKQIGGMPLGGITTSKTSAKGSEDYVAASKESLYYDLLSILHSIPIQCIAVNGPSLVNCVRYVASGLLDTVQLKNEDCMDEEAGVARAQGYLIDFLSILSDIEKNYSLDDE